VYFDDQAITGIPVPVGDAADPIGATVHATCGDADDAPDCDTMDYGTGGYDTDGDGRNDTVLITDPAGSSILLTDVDGDGAADIATEITTEGLVTVSEHTSDSQWTVVERGWLGSAGGTDRADDASVGFASSGSDSAGSASAGPGSLPDAVVSIDPTTGEWIQDCPPPIVPGPSRPAPPPHGLRATAP
jgi:hypothetical protein